MAEEITGTLSCTPSVEGSRLWFTGPATVSWHQVKIDKVSNGFVIEIGCKKFVAENWEVLAKKLGEYWRDPVAAEKKYCK